MFEDRDTVGSSLPPRFKGLQQLGAGAEGTVWSAYDGELRRRVTVKWVPPAQAGHAHRLFSLLRRNGSPHLPSVLELLPESSGGRWLISAMVDGAPLEAGPVPLAVALADGLGVAHGLMALHRCGTHHGDLSPSNVIITLTRAAVLVDFGNLGTLGSGTPGYLAPEVLRGSGGPEADRFGLGCLLCFRMFGAPPWARPEMLLKARGITDVRRRLRELARKTGVMVPDPVMRLLERLLHPDPRERVQDPALLVDRLRRLQAAATGESLGDLGPCWWTPPRWPFSGQGVPRVEDPIRLVVVSGPAGSGRARCVEDWVERGQERGSSAAMGGGEEFLGRWLHAAAGSELGVSAPNWPADLASTEARTAALLTASSLAQARLCVVVDAEVGAALGAAADQSILVVQRAPLSLADVRMIVASAFDGANAEAWCSALFKATGGWSGHLLRAIEVCAANPQLEVDPQRIAEALLLGEGDESMDVSLASIVLEHAWQVGISVALPHHLRDENGHPTPWAIAAARKSLGASVGDLAREARRSVSGSISAELAFDVDDTAAVDDIILRRGNHALDPAALRFVERAAQRFAPAVRTAVARELLRIGQASRALAVVSGASDPACDIEAARALQQLGRTEEALERLEEGARAEEPNAIALRWRSWIDLGRADEAARAAAGWRGRSGRTPFTSGEPAISLWAAFAASAIGDFPTARECCDECIHSTDGNHDLAGLRARALQMRGNLAHSDGDLRRAAADYRASRDGFEAAREPLGVAHCDAMIAALAISSGQITDALARGHAAIREFLALGQLQALPIAAHNLALAQVRAGELDEGRRLLNSISELCALQSASSSLPRCRLRTGSLALDLAQARHPGGAGRGELLIRATMLASELEHLGNSSEAAPVWLWAASLARETSNSSEAAAALGQAERITRELLDRELIAACAIERLEQADDQERIRAIRCVEEIVADGQLEAHGACELDVLARVALFRAHRRTSGAGSAPVRASVAALIPALEAMMNKNSALERRSVRQHLLGEAADPSTLEGLASELVADGLGTHLGPNTHGSERGSVEVDSRRLLRIFRRIASEDSLERILDQVLEAMMEITDAERGALSVGDGEQRRVVTRELVSGDEQAGYSRSILERVQASGEPVLSVDAATDARFDGARSISHLNLRSVIAVPLQWHGERIGAAYVDHRLRRGTFDETDLARLEDFAGFATLAIAHARALTSLREQAAVLTDQQQRLEAMLEESEIRVQGLREEVLAAVPQRKLYRGMLGTSEVMQRVFRTVDRVADSDVPVVIHGESGTGKELVARAIHDGGRRATRPFVAENCGAIPETLLESVLFGHARGAFTGASSARPGLFEAANLGTIFLDEIGEMSPAMQTKLLRVLQDGEVRRIGENLPRSVDVRLVTATHRDLEQMVADGGFRQDLYYRIHVVRIELPPLRQRREDIPLLVEHFLARGSERCGRALQVSGTAMRLLLRYGWPGNVRELENEVSRWLALAESRVDPEDLSSAMRSTETAADDPDDLELRPRVDKLERDLISQALRRTEGNLTQAAELLGLSRFGLQKKLRRASEGEAV